MMATLVQGIQGQWFKLPLEGTADIFEGMNDYFSTLSTLSKDNQNIYVEKGNQPYQ